MENNIITNNASEQMIDKSSEVEAVELNPGSTKEHWIKRNKTKIFLTIIGILGICLIGTIDSLVKTEQQLKQKTESLLWLAFEHRAVRNERDFFSKIAEDVNYYKFIKTVYESKDRDFFETITLAYEESVRQKINPYLTLSIMRHESNFNQYAASYCSYGLLQINFNAWKNEKQLTMTNIFDKKVNVRVGLEIYNYYLKRANGDPWLALLYYNNGEAMPLKKQNRSYPTLVLNSKYHLLSHNFKVLN